MKKFWNKTFAMILSALMVCTMAPMSAIAAENTDSAGIMQDDDKIAETIWASKDSSDMSQTTKVTNASGENDNAGETETVKNADNTSETKKNAADEAQASSKDTGDADNVAENETSSDVIATFENEASAEEIQDVTATGVDFSTEPTEKITYKAGEGTITYTPATAQSPATITLENATFTGTNKKSSRAILVNVNGNYNVVLSGSNTISGFEAAIGSGSGNLEESKVTFSGTGSLNVTDCDYFAHSLRDTIFDGVQLNVNVRLNGILTMGIAEFKNGTNAVFTSQDSNSANIQAQSGTYINSKSHVEINGKYAGIYLAMVYYSRPEKGVEIDDAELEINTNSFGIVSENYPITIHNAKVSIKNSAYGMYTAYDKNYPTGERKIDISGNSNVKVQAGYGVVTSKMYVKDKAEVEIISDTSVNLGKVGVDISEHHYAFKTLVNNEATAEGAGDWDQTTTMDQFKYLHIMPITYDMADVSVSAKADSIYNGAAQAPEIVKNATTTNDEAVTLTYATEENGVYTEEIPSFTEAGTYTIYYKVNAESHNEVSGHFTFTIKNAAQEAPAVTGNAETISKKADGTISGLTTDMAYATSENGPYTKVTDPKMTFAAGTYYVCYPEKTNYDASQPTKVTIAAGRKLTVTMPENQEGYILTADKTELDWHEAVTVNYTLKSGYEEVAGEFGILLNGTPVTLNNGSFVAEGNETDVVFTITGVRAVAKDGEDEDTIKKDTTTDNKSQTTTSGTTTTGKSTPKTADDTPLGVLYATLFGSCAVIGLGMMGKKRRKHVRR